MSDLTAAAAALGLPEALVQRSAAARATETGASVDDILAQWAGGETAPTPPPVATTPEPAETATTEATTDVTPAAAPAPAPAITIEIPDQPAAAPAPAAAAGPFKPPVLVGAKDNPMTVLAGVIGLFVVVVMVGLFGPSLPTESPGARTSEVTFSEGALHGRDVYAVTGCAACHTQMVRPVIADVGLGPVTLHDTNQILGTRRFGPDLADVGARITGSQIEAIVTGLGDHPAHDLASEDMADLVAYLSEAASAAPGADS